MADHTFLTLLCLLLLSPLSSAADVTREACKASRDPPTCVALLSSHVPPNATLSQVIQTALTVATLNLDKGRTLINRFLSDSDKNWNWSDAAHNCLDSVRYSEYRVNLVGPAVATRHTLKDARAWMSAALVYQESCCSKLKSVQANETKSGADAIGFFNSTLIPGSSSALAMILNLDINGPKTRFWGPPKTERDGFWEPFPRASGSRPAAGVPAGLNADATVCKSGCKYMTVQAAVNATPDNLGIGKRFVIRIKTGVYQETVRVPLEKKNVVFIGDGMGKTVITGSNSVGLVKGMTTYNSATVGVIGDGFMARYLTIENTAGAHQAVAFRSDSDHSIMENCELLGNQDTVYAVSLRQYYKSCHIQGNVDFIFGNSAAVFQDCSILISPRQVDPEKGEKNTVTAHGRTDPGQSTGFVFRNSVIKGTKAYMDLYQKNPKVHQNYLGRPWREYARTVFIECALEGLVSAEGWMPWKGDFGLGTAYYAEFNNTGAGFNPSKRVNWSSLIPPGRIEAYSAQNFIQAF